MATTKIVTNLSVDDPLIQDANYRFDSADRQYIDQQILGLEQHLVNCLIKGKQATYFLVDTTSVALVSGDVVCAYGLVNGEITVGKATTAPVTTAGSAIGVVLLAANPGGYVLVSFAGIVPASITGMATGAAGYAVLNQTTGRLGYSASITGVTLGKVDPSGNTLVYQVPSVAGGGGTPGGASAQLQYNNGGAFGGTSNVTYDGTGLVVNASGFVSFGTPPTLGNIRLPNGGTVYGRGPAAENAVLLRYGNGGAYLFEVGETSNVGEVRLLATASGGSLTGYLGASNVFAFTTTTATIPQGLQLGSGTYATAGAIRLAYNSGSAVPVLVVKSSTNTDTPIVTFGAGDACTFGNAALDLTLRGVTFSALISSGGISTTTGKQVVYSNAVNCWVGALDSTGTSAHTLTTIAAATAIEMYAPVRGITSGSANLPLRFGVSTITTTNGSTTLTQAQYANPALLAAAGATAAVTWVLPLVAGTFYDIYNASSQTLTVGGSSGTTVAIATLTKARVGCWDGANYK